MNNSEGHDVLQEGDTLAQVAVDRQVKGQGEHGAASRTQPGVASSTCLIKDRVSYIFACFPLLFFLSTR